ncbi:MAG: helix-hairpin-helix domain-containing protein [Pyrinomonadaceae bacterium]
MKRTVSQFTFRLICCCLMAVLAPACVKVPRRASATGDQGPTQITPGESAPPRISLNRATREELEKLPGIGPALAARIVEERTRYGPFRRAEHLIMVRGISDRRFRQMRSLLTAE